MKQTLLVIPEMLDGWPVFGMGLLLLAWLAFSAGLFVVLVRKHGFGEETRSYLPMLIVVAAGILWLLPHLVVREEGGLPIRGYGVMMMFGIVGGVLLATSRAPALGLDPDKIFSLAFWLFLGGILGARLFHVIQYRDSYDSLVKVINIQEGGLVVYGAFIGGMVAVMAFVRRHRLPLLAVADLLAPSFALGLCLGRIGCLLTGCCFGGTCDLPWAVTFPSLSTPYKMSPPYQRQIELGLAYGIQIGQDADGTPVIARVLDGSKADELGFARGQRIVRIGRYPDPTPRDVRRAIQQAVDPPENESPEFKPGPLLLATDQHAEPVKLPAALPARSLPVHPTQVYSAINAALLCLLLLAYSPHRRHDGEVMALLLSIYPVTRFLLEMLRTDELGKFGTGLTISQLVSLAMLLVAGLLWWYLRRQPTGQLWAAGGETTAAAN
ncbi:MAG: hypothetical protein DWQ42_07360 [Planctomycetota bacterium]|nr:MAG: hypothetical protein DWQ42_07360 [Planctomycetota bacterium]REK37885.1 MAG: hypothetical protein DWQ46_21750 [Planctomycetota bacterium]